MTAARVDRGGRGAGGYELVAVEMRVSHIAVRVAHGSRTGERATAVGQALDPDRRRWPSPVDLGRMPSEHTRRTAIVPTWRGPARRRDPSEPPGPARRHSAAAPSARPRAVAGPDHLGGMNGGPASRGASRMEPAVRARTWPPPPLFQLDHILVSPGYDAGPAEVLDETRATNRPVRASPLVGARRALRIEAEPNLRACAAGVAPAPVGVGRCSDQRVS